MIEHAFLAGFSPQQRADLSAAAQAFEAAAGDLLAREGKPADAFYLIQAGQVAIELNRPGKEAAHIQTIGPNEAVGWSWIVPPYRWEYDARALDLVAGVRFDANLLRKLCERDIALRAALYEKLVAIIAARLTATRLQLLDLYQ
jgi:CRP/FNR family transcriptional regulator, cyclic AMP receptor protein